MGVVSSTPAARSGWRLTRLEEIAADVPNAIVDGPFGSNLKASDYIDPPGVPVLQGGNVTGNRFSWSGVRYLSDAKAAALMRSAVRVGDILTVKVGSVGYSAVVDDLHGHAFAIIPANMIKMTVNPSVADRGFIHQVLTSPMGVDLLRSAAGSTAQPAMSLRSFKAIQVLLPPLPEQQEIGAILSSVDEVIRATNAVIVQIERFKIALLSEIFKTGLRAADHVQVRTVAAVVAGGTPDRSRPEYYGGKIPWVKSGEVNAYYINSTEERISDLGLRNSAAKVIPARSTLVAMYGATAGAVGLLEVEAATNQAVSAVIAGPAVQRDYLFFALQACRSDLLEQTQGSGQPNLNGAMIKSLLIPLPPHDKQADIARVFTAVDDEIECHRRIVRRLQEVKGGLLDDLLTGKVRVTA